MELHKLLILVDDEAPLRCKVIIFLKDTLVLNFNIEKNTEKTEKDKVIKNSIKLLKKEFPKKEKDFSFDFYDKAIYYKI